MLLVTAAAGLSRLDTALLDHPQLGTDGLAWCAWAGDVLFWLGNPLLPIIALFIPDGRLPGPRWRPVAAAAVGLWVALGIAELFEPGPRGDEEGTPLINPIGIDAPHDLYSALRISLPGLALIFVLAVIGMVARYRRSRGRTRRHICWLAGVLGAAFTCVAIGAPFGGDSAIATQIGLAFLLVGLPIVLCAAALTDELPGIDLLAGRAFVLAVTGVFLGAVYVTVVLGVAALVGHTGDSVAVVLATGAVAVLFAPVRVRVQSAAQRRLFGDEGDHSAAVARLSRALREAHEQTMLADLVDAVAEALATPYVTIVTAAGNSASHGVEAEGVVTRDLRWSGESVGTLTVSLPPTPRRSGDRTPPTPALIDALCPFLAAALGAAALMEQVHESRAELVSAIEDERRRIRRDLHDGLGPALAGIGLGLETVENLAAAEAPAIYALARTLRDGVATAHEDVRLLVRGLRPPALDDLGLVGALRTQADRLAPADGRLQIVVDADPDELGALPAAVELAAYHITMEALANVVRHARASVCEVRMRRGTGLELEIRDDGTGLAGGTAGFGLRSMRERCEQLGGRFDVATADSHGTLVNAWIPIGDRHELTVRT